VLGGAVYSTVGGGFGNTSSGQYATVGGGDQNTSSGGFTTVGGGDHNTSSVGFAAVGGGYGNTSSGGLATVGGGQDNTSSGYTTTVGGGSFNQATNDYATVPGGFDNLAGGQYSFAAGQQAQALHQGSFVWADSQNSTFASTTTDQFNVRATGGVRFETAGAGATIDGGQIALRAGGNTFTNGQIFNGQIQLDSTDGFSQSSSGNFDIDAPFIAGGRVRVLTNGNVGIGNNAPSQKLTVNGNILASGTVNGGSDRNVKEHFSSVSARDVLEKVSALPITEWNYKTDNETLRHIGPMAQDFYAAFRVGMDDKHISMVDADGVALAAIQGLNQKLEEQRAENADLKQRLEKLEQLVSRQNGGGK
jgi:trimeric autotransporter adhesin